MTKTKDVSRGAADQKGPTRALDRGLQVMEVVARQPRSSLAEIALAADLSPPTALRVLKTLEARGYVDREDTTRTYSIGLTAFEVGSKFLSDTRLVESCKLILRDLSSRVGQSTTLAVLHGADVVYVDAQEGSSHLRSAPKIGGRAPAHATASGKCLLAARWGQGLLDSIGPGPYVALTSRTLTEAVSLREELEEVRKLGLAYDREELYPDISCIACPIYDRSGEVIAAIAVQSLTSQLLQHEQAWTVALRAAAAEASMRLGWRDSQSRSYVASANLLID